MKMNKFLIIISLLFFTDFHAQIIDLNKLVKNSYFQTLADSSLIKNKDIVFIEPSNIPFIKTGILKDKYSFKIISLKKETQLKDFVKDKKDDTLVFNLNIEKVCNNKMILLLSINSVNNNTYNDGIIPFFIFQDKRSVEMVYNPKIKEWIFAKVLEISDEPHLN